MISQDTAHPLRASWSLALGLALAVTAAAQDGRQAYGPAYRRPLPPGYHQPRRPALRRAAAPVPRRLVERDVVPVFYPAGIDGEATAPAEPPLALSEQFVPAPGEHPLMPAVRWAKTGMEELAKIEDYSCTFVKRERIGGELGENEFMFVKVRHEPFSIYMYFLGPARLKGREVMYVAGRNEGKLLAHGTGAEKLFGTMRLEPTSMLAMRGNRYPIAEFGLKRLTQRLLEVGEHDTQFGECDVKFLPGAKINGRDCTCIQVVHPVPRREFIFHQARIFVDTERNLPIRYEAYDWPRDRGDPPALTEEYTYLNLKLNNGYTDADFDTRNPNYQFP